MKEIIDRLDVTSDKEKMFWSGDKVLAAKIAKERGKIILEQTPGGRIIDQWDELDKAFPWDGTVLGPHGWDFWGTISTEYTKGVSGEVDIIQAVSKFPRGGDIWRGYEWKTIVREDKVTSLNIFAIDESGKILQTIKTKPNSAIAKELFGK